MIAGSTHSSAPVSLVSPQRICRLRRSLQAQCISNGRIWIPCNHASATLIITSSNHNTIMALAHEHGRVYAGSTEQAVVRPAGRGVIAGSSLALRILRHYD